MWFVNQFHVQILVLEILFCLRLQRRKLFWVRFLPAAGAYLALPLLTPGGFFSPYVTWNWFTFGFLVMFVLSGLVIWLCFHMNARQVIFYCCVAHTFQHMVHCLHRMAEMGLGLSFAWGQSLQLLFFLVTCGIVYALQKTRFRGSETADFQNGYLLIFAVASTLIIYVLSYCTTSREVETIGVLFFDCSTCLLLVFILLDIFRIRAAERENLIMQRMLRQEQEQHTLSRATIDAVNRKCHDLRHQIAALRHMSSDEQEKSISELESAVLIYDSFPKSGNVDVDIILAEKSMLAEESGISIRSMVDGAGLGFMKTEDLYILLGNALDNAIEAVRQVDDREGRVISFTAAPRDRMFCIHMENPCPREPLFMDGLPVTSKQDTDYHGYGMRSIRYVCEKYKGAVRTGWEDGVFTLDMLFPMP